MEFDIRDTNAARLLNTIINQNHSMLLLMNKILKALEGQNVLARGTEPPQRHYSSMGMMPPWRAEE